MGILVALITPEVGHGAQRLVRPFRRDRGDQWVAFHRKLRGEIMAGLRADLDGNPFGYLEASFLNL